jgi:hypothetical protein
MQSFEELNERATQELHSLTFLHWIDLYWTIIDYSGNNAGAIRISFLKNVKILSMLFSNLTRQAPLCAPDLEASQ